MASLPTGTVTILFTDIEGSTRLLQRLGADDARENGEERVAADALRAAVDAQRQLATHDWPVTAVVAVRMGIHTGDVRLSNGEYVGLDIHRAARISAAAHGGQVLISDTTRALIGASLPSDVTLRDLGEHRLKDIDEAEHLHQLVINGLRSKTASRPARLSSVNCPPARLAELCAEGGRQSVDQVVRLALDFQLDF